MKSKIIDNGFEAHDIYELTYTRTGFRAIVIGVVAGEKELAYLDIFFPDIRGLRVLDEGDLIKYWESEQFRSANCVYEIIEGGWLQEEIVGILSVSSSVGGYVEYLVATNDYCASILASKPPTLKVYPDPYPLAK